MVLRHPISRVQHFKHQEYQVASQAYLTTFDSCLLWSIFITVAFIAAARWHHASSCTLTTGLLACRGGENTIKQRPSSVAMADVQASVAHSAPRRCLPHLPQQGDRVPFLQIGHALVHVLLPYLGVD